jgi:hypothetical protein
VEEPCTGGVTAWRGAPFSELSRLAAASLPPALGCEREPLPPPRVGGLRARPELDFTAHPPLGFIPSPVSHTGRSSPFGGIPLRSCSQPAPYACSGCCGRRLPGGALPGTRASPNPLFPRAGSAPGPMASGSRPPRPRRAKGSAAGAHRPQAAFGAKGPYGGPLGGAWTKGLAHRLLSSPSRGEPLFTAGGWERAVRAEKRGFFGPALGSPPSSAVFWGAALLARCLLHRCCQPPSFYPRPIPRRAFSRAHCHLARRVHCSYSAAGA